MKRAAVKRWQFVHRWSSLVSTAFLLMLCVTGLPLIFHEEIERFLQPPLPTSSENSPELMQLIDRALAKDAGLVIHQLYFLPDRRLVEVEVGRPGDFEGASAQRHMFDMMTGNNVPEAVGSPVLDFIHQLHVDMFAGLAGSLFLGTMGLLLIVAIISGIVLYGPFTRKLPFGTVRPARRARWLDLHNLLGIVTVAWLGVVGLTGAINTLSAPVARHWQQTDLTAMAAPFMKGEPPSNLAPVADVIAIAERAAPGMWVTGVYYPGSPYATPRHYGVYLRGSTPVTARLLTPMLIDATSGRIDAIGRMPLHVNVLLLSQPLHFGDYGGVPLKFLWAVLDFAAIAVLVTGLWLYFKRGQDRTYKRAEKISRTTQLHKAAPSFGRQWFIPSIVGGASFVGLILALLSPPGPGRWIAWMLIATPVLACGATISGRKGK